jgi:carbon monoxide dehydrogenase subunit G
MQRVERSAEIIAPPDAVFAYVADLDNLPAWLVGVRSARRTSEGQLGVGSSAAIVRELMGQRIEADLRITAYEPPARVSVESEVSGVRVVIDIAAAPNQTGTTLTMTITLRAGGLTAFMEPMLAAAAAGDLEASLARLQERFAAP